MNSLNSKRPYEKTLLPKVLLIFTFVLLLSNCSSDDPTNEIENCDTLAITCPGGEVCDENYLYRAYEFRNEKLFFYISFDPKIVNNYSLEAFRKNFNHLDFTVYFPEMATDSSEFYFSDLRPIRQLNQKAENGFELTIDDYENGRLKGTLKGTITKITEIITSDDPTCISDDILGTCYSTEDANILFSVDYDFCIEQ